MLTLPSLPQLYRKDGTPDPNRVYYIAEYDADVNYQEEADATREGFLRGRIPKNGYYFRRSGKIKEWAISGKMKPVRVLTMQEVDEINRKAGLETINGYPVELLKKKGLPTPDIRFQIEEAKLSATEKAQKRMAEIAVAAKNAQIRARATYRALRVKMNARAVVTHWENAMRQSLVVAVKNAFPGCAPLNVKLYDALKEQLEQLDPGIEEEAKERAKIKRKMSQMLIKNKRFKKESCRSLRRV